jgi:hypothetical protein
MVSLRNINAILIFDPTNLKVRHVIIGPFVRQHDPDFIDGWTISIFDNNNVGKEQRRGSSRIVLYSLRDGASKVMFAGSPQLPFYTYVMGKHEYLANGNLLMTEPTRGRAIEVNRAGQLVFEYNNRFDSRWVGVLDEAQRITPDRISSERLNSLAKACPATNSGA